VTGLTKFVPLHSCNNNMALKKNVVAARVCRWVHCE